MSIFPALTKSLLPRNEIVVSAKPFLLGDHDIMKTIVNAILRASC